MSAFVCENCSQSACTELACAKAGLPTQLMAGMWKRVAGHGGGDRGCVN